MSDETLKYGELPLKPRTPIILKMEAFLKETVEYYNEETRCLYDNGEVFTACFCTPDLKYKNPIARKCSDEYLSEISEKDKVEGFTDEIIVEYGVPEYFDGFELAFLKAVEDFHDGADNWQFNGMSRNGVEFVEWVCDEYDLIVTNVISNYYELKMQYDDEEEE